MTISYERVEELIGDVDGVNTDFSVPTKFLVGSFRPIVNGFTYPQSDDQWGCTELNDTTIRMKNPPKVGFIMQGIYSEPVTEGTPWDPTGAHP